MPAYIAPKLRLLLTAAVALWTLVADVQMVVVGGHVLDQRAAVPATVRVLKNLREQLALDAVFFCVAVEQPLQGVVEENMLDTTDELAGIQEGVDQRPGGGEVEVFCGARREFLGVIRGPSFVVEADIDITTRLVRAMAG